MINRKVVQALASLAAANSPKQAKEAMIRARTLLGDDAVLFEPLLLQLEVRVAEMAQLQNLAGTDELTGIANRRSFIDALDREIARSIRGNGDVAVIMLDLDGLKTLNDTFGHATGDEALCEVAITCSQTLRSTDLVARIGGDEFAILLAGINKDNAVSMLRRVCSSIEAKQIKGQNLRISAGIATTASGIRKARSLMEAADARLYKSKRRRRKRHNTTPRHAA